MNRDDRKAAVAAWKQRKKPSGIYAVRCAATGEVWVGSSPVLDKIRNRLWFMLAQGGSPGKAMQAAWNAHGEGAFSFEILEELDDEVSDLSRPTVLAERVKHWREELGAAAV